MLDYEYPTVWLQPILPNIAKIEMEKTDGLLEATLTALETGELTPLVKEELKYTIQSRRLAKGQEELGVVFSDPKPSELREDEKEKINRRREQNKLAARRFRQRRRAKGPVFLKRIQELESDNTSIMAELRRLRQEKKELQTMLHNHLMICPSITIHAG